MKKTLLLIIFLSISAFPQVKFDADFDYAIFPINESSSSVEFYFSFYKSGMRAVKSDSGKSIVGLLGIQLENTSADSLITQKEYNIKYNFSDGDQNNLVGQLRYTLPLGDYKCYLVAKDYFNQENQDSVIINFTVTPKTSDRISISDIELASTIVAYDANPNSYFYKNNHEIIPNPSLIYGESKPVVYFYSQLYNISESIGSELLTIEYYIFDALNNTRYKKKKMVSRKSDNIIDIGAINVIKFPSGMYSLVVIARDTIKNVNVRSTKNFYIYNPGVKDTMDVIATISNYSSELANYDIQELDDLFAVSKLIASQNEIDAWEKLTNVIAKREFLFRFWKKRDSNKSTPENEFKKEFFRRVDFANKTFLNMLQKKGWKTDMGRIYILYGKPDDIERHFNEQDSQPYEIWRYDYIEGGIQFVFADFTDFRDFRLIHTDVIGGLSDPNWKARIKR